jgi:hypothetical protein
VTWLILGLFVFGLICSFALTILVTLEALVANRVDESVAGKGLKAIDRLPRRRSVSRFYTALKTTTEASNGNVDIETLLTSELSIYQRISHSTDVIGNLLITLGLIGTVVGLTLVLTGLTGSLEALGHDSEMMLSGLRTAMAGMGTAFYTTLLGAVLGGVLLRVFAQITEHGINSVYDAVMRTCLVHCAADLQPTMQRDLRHLDTPDRGARAAHQGAAARVRRVARDHGPVSRGGHPPARPVAGGEQDPARQHTPAQAQHRDDARRGQGDAEHQQALVGAPARRLLGTEALGPEPVS